MLDMQRMYAFASLAFSVHDSWQGSWVKYSVIICLVFNFFVSPGMALSWWSCMALSNRHW
jgi:hypothetical protein